MLKTFYLRYLFNQFREPIKTSAELVEKNKINHDCYIYRLKFIDRAFELKIGEHFRITQMIKTYESSDGAEEVTRKYTPISSISQKDHLDLLIKIYRANQNIKFPSGGKMTPYLESLDKGAKLHLEGPFGNFNYEGQGDCLIKGEKKNFKRIFGIAGGSGITPIYQVINEIVKIPEDKIELCLLFANKTQEDIVLKKQLQALEPRVKVRFIVDAPTLDWKGYSGLITEDTLKDICPLDDPDTLYTFCGPFGMNAELRALFAAKYPQSSIYKF